MEIRRRIVVQAIKTKENELIPIWDDRVEYENTEMFGKVLSVKDEFGTHHSLVECIYDLKTRKLEIGIELDFYPNEDKLDFKKGEKVLYEQKHRHLSEATISDIVYEEYDLNIMKGKKMDSYYTKHFKNVDIQNDSIYAIKRWKPFYILDNGTKIEWEHELYHKS